MSKKIDSAKDQRIRVFARCRPLENVQGSTSILEVLPEINKLVLKDRNTFREYTFDKVFSPDSQQIAVYKAVVEPLIKEVLMGYSCTVFAYGQTGTGKTYTMEGKRNETKCSWRDDPAAGIIPRSLHQLYEELDQAENVEFSVKVSFIEIYNEEVYDLLSKSDLTKLHLYEDCSQKDSVKIRGVVEELVKSKDEVYTILEKGAVKRHTAETKLNACSSRSHTVFSVTVDMAEKNSNGVVVKKTGKLNLVDLAGSENVRRSGAIDKRLSLREAGNINQSLLTLGRVINALIEKQPHIPYRESKLTRILQYSLSGHAKTAIIATISPALCNLDETISTLEYAAKAKTIDINPELNRRMLRRGLIKELTIENERLRVEKENLVKDLAAARCNQGYFVDAENYESMVKKVALLEQENRTLKAKNELFQHEAVLASNDVKELHAKIRRTQTVAYTNEDICDNLRMLSQKQCADLYDMVADYSKERATFSKCFKEDQDRLNLELREHKRKTNCLRETLSTELQSLLNSVLVHLNEQATSEKQRANDLSHDLKSAKDSWVMECEDILTRRLPSILNDINAENASVVDWITNIHTSMKEKVNQHILVLKKQTAEEKKMFGNLKGLLESFFMRHDAAILDCNRKIESFSRYQNELDNIRNSCAVLQEIGESVQFENISKFEDNAARLQAAQMPLNMWDMCIKKSAEEAAQLSDALDVIKPGEFFQKRDSNMPMYLKVRNMFKDLQKLQMDNFEKASARVESQNSDALRNIQSNTSMVNDITSFSNKIDEEYLEDTLAIRKDIAASLGNVFDYSEKSYTTAASILQEALLEKDLEIEKFISDAFVKDISTGSTPQQRSFQSPRASSLYRSLHRFLVDNRINTPLKENEESGCTAGSSFLSSQDVSFGSDNFDSVGCGENSIIMPETHLDDIDIGSNKENEEVSRLSNRKSVLFSDPPTFSDNKPLSPYNSAQSKDDRK